MIPHNMTGNFSLSSFKSLVGKVFEAKAGGIVRGGLLGVADPEGDMSEAEYFAKGWSLSFFAFHVRYAIK